MRIRLLISVAMAAAAMAFASPATATPGCKDNSPASASPWSSIGAELTGKPSWVNICTERRLRLVSSLATIQQNIATLANTYFGSKGPGMSVGLVLADGLYYSKGFGSRDTKPADTPDEWTIFSTGSLSKLITGTALLTLTDNPNSNMNLQSPADQQLPEIDFVCPQFDVPCQRGATKSAITLDNLVSHTDGLPDVMEQGDATPDEWKMDLKKAWMRFPLGMASAYSGIDAESVGVIEQRATKSKSFPDFVQKNLFTPLGMTHSTMDDATLTAEQQSYVAQRWAFADTTNSWSFSEVSGNIYQPDQAMLLPAGGFLTDIEDMSQFLKMFVSDNPGATGILPGSLTSAMSVQNLAVKAAPGAPLPPSCSGGAAFDSNNPPAPVPATATSQAVSGGFFYRACQAAPSYGVNWILALPYVWHNGNNGISGSQTMVKTDQFIGATGLVSTNPYPPAPKLPNGMKEAAPPNLDTDFMNSVVWYALMVNGAVPADSGTTTWASQPLASGQELAVGIARLLWLTGAEPTNEIGSQVMLLVHDTPSTLPGKPSIPSPPIAPPKGWIVNGNVAESPALFAFQKTLVNQFNPAYVAQHMGAKPEFGVQSFLTSMFGGAHACSTFRVRDAHAANDAGIRLRCAGGSSGVENLDLRISTEPDGTIAGLADADVSQGAF